MFTSRHQIAGQNHYIKAIFWTLSIVSMSYLPQMMVVVRRLLLWDHLC
jgi:hypothetical protein